MRGKFCVSKSLLQIFGICLIASGIMYFFGRNIILNSPESRASGQSCLKDKFSYTCSTGTTVDFYVGYKNNEKKYFKDSSCTSELIDGLGNYCKNFINTSVCKIDYCTSPNNTKAFYTKDGKYYLNNSCLGSLKYVNYGTELYVDAPHIDSEYCQKKASDVLPLEYDCPSGSEVKFYYKDGKFYKDIYQQTEVTDWGVGNFCKSSETTPVPSSPPLQPTTVPQSAPNSTYIESLRVIDNTHPISATEISNTIKPNLVLVSAVSKKIRLVNPDNVYLQSVLIPDLENLFVDSTNDGVTLYIRSGFRSFDDQTISYDQAADKTTVVEPGYSQHHSGLAIDFTTPEIGNVVDEKLHFENTKAGLWLKANAYKYGFAPTYTKNHQGIANESWHYFYLGTKLAQDWFNCQTDTNPCDVFDIQYKYQNL